MTWSICRIPASFWTACPYTSELYDPEVRSCNEGSTLQLGLLYLPTPGHHLAEDTLFVSVLQPIYDVVHLSHHSGLDCIKRLRSAYSYYPVGVPALHIRIRRGPPAVVVLIPSGHLLQLTSYSDLSYIA